MRSRPLAGCLLALAVGIATYVVLGPLVLGVVDFRTSASGLNQVRGGDLAALLVVAPACASTGALALRRHPAAPVLALAPGIFAMYTYSQLILGNEYLRLPGNVERFFPLLLALFLTAAAVSILAWGRVDEATLPVPSPKLERGIGIGLLVAAAFLAFGLHGATFVDAMRDHPSTQAYLDTPTTFWVVKTWDLGILVPASLTIGVGLLRHQAWARKPMYAVLGGLVLLGCSVAGMAWSMWLNDDPDASVGQLVAMTLVAAGGLALGYRLYRPLLRRPAVVVHAAATGSAGGPPRQRAAPSGASRRARR